MPAESRSSCVFSSPLSPSLSITFRKLTRPFLISSSPIGLRQFVGGLMSLVAAIALCSSSAIVRLSPRTRGRTCFLPQGTFARMSLAACGRDAAEGRLQEAAHVVALRLARQEHQRAELDAVRVRLDLGRLLRQLGRRARERQRLVAGAVGARALRRRPRAACSGSSRAGSRAPCARRSGSRSAGPAASSPRSRARRACRAPGATAGASRRGSTTGSFFRVSSWMSNTWAALRLARRGS